MTYIVIFCSHCKAEKKRGFSGLCDACGKFPAAWHKLEDNVFEFTPGRKLIWEYYAVLSPIYRRHQK